MGEPRQGRVVRGAGRPSPALLIGGAIAVYLAIELALLWRFPIFFDEALFASESQMLVDHATWTNAFVAVADNHGVLQRWLTAGEIWVGISPIIAIRLVSIAAGAVTIAAVAAIAERLRPRTAVVGAFVAALMPALVVHSAIGIADPLAVAAIAVAALLVIELGEHPRIRTGAALAAAIAVGLLTKKTALLTLLFLPFGAWILVRRRPPQERPWRTWLAATLVAVSGAALAWIVLSFAPEEWKRVAAAYGKSEYLSVGRVIDHFFSRLGPGVAHFGSPLLAYTTIPLLIAAVCGVVDGLRRDRPELIALLATWAIVPFAAAALSAKFAYPRYTLASFPALAALAGCGLVAVLEWLRPHFTHRWLGPALAVVAFGPALVFDARVLASPGRAHYPGLDDAQYVSGFAGGPPWPGLADKLRGLAPRGPVQVAWGARGVGPIGLATELGATKLAEGTVNAGFFTARTGDGQVFAFMPYAVDPRARFLVAQDVDAIPLPPAVEQNYRVVTVVKRPHDGSSVALLERR